MLGRDCDDGRRLVRLGERVREERGGHQRDRGHQRREQAHAESQREAIRSGCGLGLNLQDAPVVEGVEACDSARRGSRLVAYLDPDLRPVDEDAARPGRDDDGVGHGPAAVRRRVFGVEAGSDAAQVVRITCAPSAKPEILADDDGFQPTADGSLRAPHNGHFEILARMGVPGLILWVLFMASYAASLVRAAWRSRQRGHVVWPAVLGFLFVYWAAVMVNSSFDPYLQGPQGGIWFWSLVGIGLAAVRHADREPHDLDAEPIVEGSPTRAGHHPAQA